MKLDIVAGSGNDEFYTPSYAITPILKYLKPNSIIWCPFDTQKSLYAQTLKQAGHNVILTHLDTGQDFFTADVPKCDYIISNPPYSKKNEVFERLFKIDKPFAMLVGVVGLFEGSTRFDLFSKNKFEIMYFNKRISYFKSYDETKPTGCPPFSSVYVCHNILPQQIMFETIYTNETRCFARRLF